MQAVSEAHLHRRGPSFLFSVGNCSSYPVARIPEVSTKEQTLHLVVLVLPERTRLRIPLASSPACSARGGLIRIATCG